MKKFRFLFLVPAIFSMVACGMGKEINADKAKEIAKGMKDVKQPEDYEATIKMVSYDAEDKTNTKAEYSLKKNSAGEFYAAIKTETTGDKEDNYDMDVAVYLVNNDKYDQVVYMKSYDNKDKKDNIEVIVKKGNELEYAQAFAEIQAEIGSLTLYLSGADQLESIIDAAEKEAKDNDNVTVKYYSNGSQNLSIKEIAKETDDKDAQFGESTITFDKGLLVSSETKMESKAGDKLEMSIKVTYPSSVKISLPSGWESYIDAK